MRAAAVAVLVAEVPAAAAAVAAVLAVAPAAVGLPAAVGPLAVARLAVAPLAVAPPVAAAVVAPAPGLRAAAPAEVRTVVERRVAGPLVMALANPTLPLVGPAPRAAVILQPLVARAVQAALPIPEPGASPALRAPQARLIRVPVARMLRPDPAPARSRRAALVVAP